MVDSHKFDLEAFVVNEYRTLRQRFGTARLEFGQPQAERDNAENSTTIVPCSP